MRSPREWSRGDRFALGISLLILGTTAFFFATRDRTGREASHLSRPSSFSKPEAGHGDATERTPTSVGNAAGGEEETVAAASRDFPFELALGGKKWSAAGQCRPLAILGRGPRLSMLSNDDWARVMKEFHHSKEALLSWLHLRSGRWKESAGAMERVRKIRIRRPPSPEEPDLAWHGAGAMSTDDQGVPVLLLGGAWFSLYQEDPKRARFELTRLVAQALAPCELQRFGVAQAWGPLVQCLGVRETENEASCSDGTYSEAGWAVSTAVAARVSPPGCVIPALSAPTGAACMAQWESEKMVERSVASAVADETRAHE